MATIEKVTVDVDHAVRTSPSTRPEQYVKPSELCDTQRRSMAYDAFAALQRHGF